MTVMRANTIGHGDRDRLLVVGPERSEDATWIARFAADHPDWEIARNSSYLSAIAELARRPAQAVVALVDASHDRLNSAVAGMREVAGASSKLILCCTPEAEPLAGKAIAHGANEYLINPPTMAELEAAIGLPSRHVRGMASEPADVPTAGMDELALLGEATTALGARPSDLLSKLAELIRTAMRCRGATIVVEGTAATSGDAKGKPVLSVPIPGGAAPCETRSGSASDAETPASADMTAPPPTSGVAAMGRILVGERTGPPYSPADMDKLNHYAAIVGQLIIAAGRQREWKRLAITDECSGLPNRRFLRERLGAVLRQAGAEQFPVTVLLFDIDDFKTYNDQFGHDAGDEIIRMIGRLFRSHCREQDIVTRYGGDEFAVVFWEPAGPREAGSKHPRQALTVLDRFTSALRTHRFPRLGASGVGRLTISGGLATFPWDGSGVDALITKADEALLAAKRAGKNRIFLVGQGEEPGAPDPT